MNIHYKGPQLITLEQLISQMRSILCGISSSWNCRNLIMIFRNLNSNEVETTNFCRTSDFLNRSKRIYLTATFAVYFLISSCTSLVERALDATIARSAKCKSHDMLPRRHKTPARHVPLCLPQVESPPSFHHRLWNSACDREKPSPFEGDATGMLKINLGDLCERTGTMLDWS